MFQLILGSVVLSLLHAIIPNHWLPILAIGKKEGWSLNETTQVTLLAGLAHALSTVVIGVVLAFLGLTLNEEIEYITNYAATAILVSMGLFFIWQHHRHKHFHLQDLGPTKTLTKRRIIWLLVVAMFFSPCLEIEAFYFAAGSLGWQPVLYISVLYLLITVIGMVIWVKFAYKGLQKFDWHRIEHNAGIITGVTLVLTGLLFFFIH
ncbi:MAG: hypothetical protein OEQ53_17265 [Saprospiraceae bacterium]|nr:hypothetical protein [Saprospiraceae bacterium]